MNMSLLRLSAALMIAAGLGACASGGSKGAIEGAQRDTIERPSTRPMEDFSSRDGSNLPGANANADDARAQLEAALANNVIYFEFDQYTLTSEGAATVRAYADYLLSNPAARIRLEGHADERGTREYNQALGERRNRAVEAALSRAGVSPSQINSLSYGEERPICAESADSCWDRNRRVEMIRL